MKRLVLVLVVVLLLASCAPKTAEKSAVHLKWMTEGDATKCMWLAQQYRELTGVDIEVLLTMPPDGKTTDVDAMFASGDPPNVYTAYGGRTSKYYNIAIPLTVDADNYVPGMLELCLNSKGQVVGIPYTFWLQSGGIDRDLAAKYGLTKYIPTNEERTWTIAQFEAMAAEFKAQAPEDSYAAMLYAASGSGDYWVQLFERGLGAHPLYNEAGKLDVAPLKGAWETFKVWEAEGWVPSGVAGLGDDTFGSMRTQEKLLFYGCEPGNSALYNAAFISYPSIDGSFVPFAVAPSVHIAIETKTDKDAAAKAFVEWLGQKEQHEILYNNWACRLDIDAAFTYNKDFTPEQRADAEANVAWTKEMLAKHGVIDIGIGSTAYQCVRDLRAQSLARVMSGEPVDVVLAEFQAQGEACFK